MREGRRGKEVREKGGEGGRRGKEVREGEGRR